MGALDIILGIVTLFIAVVVVLLVLLQSGKDKRLSGTIAGAAETFFAKGKSKTRDKILSRVTTILSFVFVVLVVVLYILASNIY